MKLMDLSKLQYVEIGQIMTDTEKDSTISANAKVSDAVALIAKRPNSALVILNLDDEVSGIVTEKDIIIALAEMGPAVLETAVETIMTDKPTVCDVTDTCEHVIKIMGHGNFRNMPVVKNNVFVGIVQVLEVSMAKMSKLIEENSGLKRIVKGILPSDAVFTREDNVETAQDFLNNNDVPYIVLEEKNEIEAIFGHVDFIRLTARNMAEKTAYIQDKIP
ncbi:MAG: CBS domain-containing protein [Tateyamaria sp.]|nr:CBS domain-containing protein [Tateyamaria sp.]